jgi:hypothetical protein
MGILGENSGPFRHSPRYLKRACVRPKIWASLNALSNTEPRWRAVPKPGASSAKL